jgi:hypothetical protein
VAAAGPARRVNPPGIPNRRLIPPPHDSRNIGASPVFDGEDNGKGEYLEYFRYTSAGTDEENERYNQCIDKNRILAQRFFRLAGNRTPVVDTIEADMKNA